MTSDLDDASPNRSEPGTARLSEAQSLVAAINEDVRLRPHDPAWAQAFDLERARLQVLLPGAFLAVEHIGSTAIAGLLAKPIIDIMAGIASFDGVEALIDLLCDNGYTTSRGFNATLTDRRWLMRWNDGHRTHHLHIVVHHGSQWRDRLVFRDALRSDPTLASRYAESKANLAAMHVSDREAYTEAKAEFVRAVVAGNSPN